MDLQGKVIAALPARSGTSARGEWKAQDFVIETHENYPHKMVFSVFGEERLQRFNIQIGQEVNVHLMSVRLIRQRLAQLFLQRLLVLLRLDRLLLQVLRLHSLHSRMPKVKVQMICHSKEDRFY